MSEQEYHEDQPQPVIPPETVVDDPKKPMKAIVSGVVSALGVFIAFWVQDDDPFTKKEAGEALLAALAVAVPSFGLTFTVSNPKKVVYGPR